MKLIASAHDKAAMEKMINGYFYSNKYTLSDTLQIPHPDKQITAFKVVAKGKRLRFEQI